MKYFLGEYNCLEEKKRQLDDSIPEEAKLIWLTSSQFLSASSRCYNVLPFFPLSRRGELGRGKEKGGGIGLWV